MWLAARRKGIARSAPLHLIPVTRVVHGRMGKEPQKALNLAKQLVPGLSGLVAVRREDNFINYHVVAVFEGVDPNRRIFFDFRGFNHLSVCIHVCDVLAECVVHGFGCFGFQGQGIARSELRGGAKTFGCRGRGFSHSIGLRGNRGGGRGCLREKH
jgi:hypothetical protein